MIFLNRALDVFNTAVVTPLLYVVFTSCVITASAVLFREWGSIGYEDVVGNICGFFIIVIGVFLIQAFRNLGISWQNLPKARKDTNSSGNASRPDGYSPLSHETIDVTDFRMVTEGTVVNGSLKSDRPSLANGGIYHNRTSSYS